MALLIITTILWAFSFSLIGEYLAGHVDSYFSVLMRVGLAALVFLPFLRTRGQSLKTILLYMLVGAMQLGIMYLFSFRAYVYLSVSEFLLFTVLTPLYITLIYDLLSKRRLRWGYVLSADVVPGDILLLDDGRVQLKVLDVQGMKVFTEVTVGGPLSNNKGINKLGGGLSAEALTEKDKADIVTAALIGVDYLAVSFPRCGEDLNYARRLARDAGCDAKIVAKVERAEAVCDQDAMDDVILASDVVMVARGDLGVEIGDPELVGIQKALIRRARQLNRAVITATQMMESMITNPMPTRAEVMDVANAVLDGTDAVMLSAETAAGQYPAETVAAMARVCLGAEKIPSINVSKHRLDVQFDNVEEAIAMSAVYAANHLKGVTAIITMTESGRTALMTSRISSGLPIFAMSRHERTLNLTALYRGVTPVHFDSACDGVAAATDAVNLLRDKGYLVSGDIVIVTQGDVMSTIGSTNTTRVMTVE